MKLKTHDLLTMLLFLAILSWNLESVQATTLLVQDREDESATRRQNEDADQERDDDEEEEERKVERNELVDEDQEQESEEREIEEREIEEREEERRISLRDVIKFSRNHVPDFAEQIKRVLDEEGDEDEVVEHLVDIGTEMIHGYEETVEGHGRRMGERFLELFQINLRLEMIVDGFKEAAAQDQARFKKEIKQLITKRYTLELILEKAELNRLKSEVEEFEAHVEQREADREDNISSQLEEWLEELGQRKESGRRDDEDEEEERYEREVEERDDVESDADDESEEIDDEDEVDDEDEKEEVDDGKKSDGPGIDYESLNRVEPSGRNQAT